MFLQDVYSGRGLITGTQGFFLCVSLCTCVYLCVFLYLCVCLYEVHSIGNLGDDYQDPHQESVTSDSQLPSFMQLATFININPVVVITTINIAVIIIKARQS